MTLVENSVETGSFEIEGRIYRLDDHSKRVLWVKGIIEHDSQGNPAALYGSVLDVTEQLQFDRKIKESNKKYNQLFQQSADAIVLVNAENGKIVEFNKAFERLAGRDPADLLSMAFWETRLPENSVQVKKVYDKILGSENFEIFEMNLVRDDGTAIPIEITGSRIDLDGEVFVQAGIRDISPRLIAEAEMRKAQTIIQTNPDAVISTTPEGIITYWNSAAEKIYGYTAKEALGKSIQMIYRPEDYPFLEQVISDVFAQEQISSREITCLHKEQREVHILFSGSSIKDHNGKIIELVGITKDITDLVHTRQKLKASENRFRSSFEVSDVGMALLSYEGNFLSINDSLSQNLKYSQKDLLGVSLFDILHPDNLKRCKQDFKNCVEEGASVHHECKYLTPSGQEVVCLTTISPVLDAEGKFLYGIAHFQDITQRKLIETELKETTRQLETLFGNLPGMVYQCKNDADWTMELVSDGAHTLTGYQSADLLLNSKVSFNEIIHLEDRQKVRDSVDLGIKENSRFEASYRIITKDGEEKWVWEQGVAVQPSNGGEITSLEGFIIDITDQMKAEAAREESEQRFRETFENIRDGIAIYEAVDDGEDFIFKDINPAGVQSGGKTREEHLGRSVREVYPGISEMGLFEIFQDVWKTGKAVHFPTTLYQDDQISLWFENHVVKLPSGEIMAVYEDQTEAKIAEDARRAQNEFILTILDNLPIGLAVNYIDEWHMPRI